MDNLKRILMTTKFRQKREVAFTLNRSARSHKTGLAYSGSVGNITSGLYYKTFRIVIYDRNAIGQY